MPGPKSISLLPWQECGECSEARFPQLSVPPRDAESNRQRFYPNKFGNSSDSLENHALVSDKGRVSLTVKAVKRCNDECGRPILHGFVPTDGQFRT